MVLLSCWKRPEVTKYVSHSRLKNTKKKKKAAFVNPLIPFDCCVITYSKVAIVGVVVVVFLVALLHDARHLLARNKKAGIMRERGNYSTRVVNENTAQSVNLLKANHVSVVSNINLGTLRTGCTLQRQGLKGCRRTMTVPPCSDKKNGSGWGAKRDRKR